MATTLTSTEISVTFPGDISDFLRRRAEREGVSVPKAAFAIMADVMEEDEDEISPEEEAYLVELAKEAERTSTGTITMEEMWKKIDAL